MSDDAKSPESDGAKSSEDGAPPSLCQPPFEPPPSLNQHLPPFDDASPNINRRKKPKVKESIIDHTYRDYSQVQVALEEDDGVGGGKKESRTHPNFPAKLHDILSNPAYQQIVCWMPHGRSWKIVDKYLLTTVILPQHFAHSKFESFNRSVNGWGFKRLLGEGPDKKTYYHECFLRSRSDLTKLMQRLCNPGKRLPDKTGEPNFYEISKNYPLPDLPSGPTAMISYEQNTPKAAQSPHQSAQPAMFASPPHAGYMFGYPQASPYASMPSPVANGQQPQQMYWPGQMSSSPYQQHPYGYYPYPQMMMAPQAGPQGYYVVQPYHQPQYFPQAPAAALATSSATAGSAEMAFFQGAAMDTEKLMGMTAVSQAEGTMKVASDAKNIEDPKGVTESNAKEAAPEAAKTEPEDVKPGENKGAPAAIKTEEPEGAKPAESKVVTDAIRTEEPEGAKPAAIKTEEPEGAKPAEIKVATDAIKTEEPEGVTPAAMAERKAKESTDTAKTEEPEESNPATNTEETAGALDNPEESKEAKPVVQAESNAEESKVSTKTEEPEGMETDAKSASTTEESKDDAKSEEPEGKPDEQAENKEAVDADAAKNAVSPRGSSRLRQRAMREKKEKNENDKEDKNAEV